MSSQFSEASEMNISRLESLNNFLLLCNMSPVKQLANLLLQSSERTMNRYLAKARQCFSAVAETISPNEGSLILKSLLHEEQENEPCQDLLKDIYLNADSWQFRRQILSIIIAQMSFGKAQQVSTTYISMDFNPTL